VSALIERRRDDDVLILEWDVKGRRLISGTS
jgi:hypothetical protein